MTRINILTGENTALEKIFTDSGYTVTTASLSDNPGSILTAWAALKPDFTMIELDHETALPDTETMRTIARVSRTICLAGCVTPEISGLLTSSGISDCISPFTPQSAAGYLMTLAAPEPAVKGTFTLLDKNPSHAAIISGIVTRFGYNLHTVGTIDQFFGYINSNPSVMILMNIGSEGIDFNRLIRESYASPGIKKAPVVAYKDMREGLFVHEVLNGLKKITRLILSPDELYCMIADILFKKEVTTSAAAFNRSSLHEKYKNYAGLTLQQIYYEIQPDPGAREPLLQHERTAMMTMELERLKRIIILSEGISWLCGTGGSRKPTCGAGA